MNILENYDNDYLSADEFLAKRDEIDEVGYLQNYLSDEYICMRLKNHYYHGNNYIKDFIRLLKNNTAFAQIIDNITMDNIINDNDESSITIKIKGETIKIDFRYKLIIYKDKKIIILMTILSRKKKPINRKARELRWSIS